MKYNSDRIISHVPESFLGKNCTTLRSDGTKLFIFIVKFVELLIFMHCQIIYAVKILYIKNFYIGIN